MSLTTIDGKGLLTLTNEFRMLFKEYLGLKREQNEALNNIAEALTAFAKKTFRMMKRRKTNPIKKKLCF